MYSISYHIINILHQYPKTIQSSIYMFISRIYPMIPQIYTMVKNVTVNLSLILQIIKFCLKWSFFCLASFNTSSNIPFISFVCLKIQFKFCNRNLTIYIKNVTVDDSSIVKSVKFWSGWYFWIIGSLSRSRDILFLTSFCS